MTAVAMVIISANPREQGASPTNVVTEVCDRPESSLKVPFLRCGMTR